MAVGQSDHALFYSIYNGKICRSFKAPTKTSVSRVNKMNNTVHEEFYDWIDGIIVGIEIAEHKEYGKSWRVKLKAGDDLQVLQLGYSDGHAIAFLKLLPNVNLKSHVKIIPSLKKDGDKEQRSIFITQHGTPIKHFWTKDAPGDLPPLEQKKIKGKISWDNSEQMEFFEEFIKKQIVPHLPKQDTPAHAVGAIQDEESDGAADTGKVDEKLPF